MDSLLLSMTTHVGCSCGSGAQYVAPEIDFFAFSHPDILTSSETPTDSEGEQWSPWY